MNYYKSSSTHLIRNILTTGITGMFSKLETNAKQAKKNVDLVI